MLPATMPDFVPDDRQPFGARRRPGARFVGAPRRCAPKSPSSRRLALCRPTSAESATLLAPKRELISAQTLR